MGSKHSVVQGTHSDYKTKFMHKIFEERLDESIIDQPALYYHDEVHGARETSFDELNRNSNRLATCILNILRKQSADRNQDGDYVIAVCMTTNDHVIAALLAIWKSGSAYLPLEPNFPPNRIDHIVNESKPVLVICDEDLDRSLFKNANSISYNELLTQSSKCSEENIHTLNSVSRSEDDVAIVLYTSGSTGTPQGVRIPHTAVLNKLQWLESKFPFSATEHVAPLNSALINVDSVAELWAPLLNGVAVLVIPPKVTRDPSKLVDLLELYKVERLVLVPTLLKSILAYLSLRNERLLMNIRTWISSGETLRTSLAEKFFEYFNDGTHRLCNFYGSTEVMGDVTFYVCHNMDELEGLSNVPIGYCLDNTVIFILSDNLIPIKPGDLGEIFVAGLNLAKGYVAGREKSKFILNRFTDNPKFNRLYRTGDFGKLIKDGCIQYEGRADSQIKVRGNRVEILEIDRILCSLEEVDKGVVLCYHAGKQDQAVLAFVVLKNDVGSPSQQSSHIENFLRTKLRDFEIPQVIVVRSMPLLPSGKIDRQTLLNLYENGNRTSDIVYDLTGISSERLEVAEKVFEIIGDVIGSRTRATISARSNFYELGGDSLNSVLTVIQLRDKGYFIGVTDFITANCLEEVLDKICDEESVEENITKFNTIPLTMHHKYQVISLMTTTFSEKLDLGIYLSAQSYYDNYKQLIEQSWNYILEKNLSFAVTDRNGDIVGISLNIDGQDPPHFTINDSLGVILEFLDSIEKPILEKQLPQGKNQVFQAFVMATSAKLTPQENIEAIQKMEEENLDCARRKGFVGIFSSNTSPLTQQLDSNIYGYQILVNYQVNKYRSRDGTKPFKNAPDSQKVMVHWKNITELSEFL